MKSALPTAELSATRVFLRADLNVTTSDGVILDDFRLRALIPTLNLLTTKGAKIILATHRGRPQGPDTALSTEILMSWFAQQGYRIMFAPTLEEAHHVSHIIDPGTILLLENLRFHQEERGGTPEDQRAYADKLRALADYYVNDAWAVVHTHDISVTMLPTLFEHRTIGLLIEKEVKELSKLRKPQRPFVMIFGGAKLNKLDVIEQAVDLADTLLILPALAFTFLKAQGYEVGQSLVDDARLTQARTILDRAASMGTHLILPTDYLVGNKDLSGSVAISDTIPHDKMGIAVGPTTLSTYTESLTHAKTIFFNGTMGFFERPDTLGPVKKLLQTIAQTNTYSVVGGGESVAAVNLFHLEQDISFCSTGGGATTYYIVHGTAPGLEAFYLL